MLNNINNQVFGQRYDSIEPLIIEIDTRNTIEGGSTFNEFLIPMNDTSLDSYINYRVDWGDGSWSRIQSKSEGLVPHVYEEAGIYEVKFYAPYQAINNVNYRVNLRYEGNQTERLKLLKIKQWGLFGVARGAFINCINLTIDNITGKIPLFYGTGETLFANCRFTHIDRLSEIVWSGTNRTSIFQNNPNFNQSFIFNAPNANVVGGTFNGCTALNSTIIFNTPNVSNINNLFRNCTAFNQDISTWFDWTKITNMTNLMTGKSFSNYNPEYYDNLLIALDNAGNSNVTLGMGNIRYTAIGQTARANLISKGWTITDGGLE